MKIYLRILQYAPRTGWQFSKFLIYSVIGSLCSSIYLALIGPMMNLLFLQKVQAAPVAPGAFSLNIGYVKDWFQYYFANIYYTKGPAETLLFVCGLIIFFVFFTDLFRYLERMVASVVKADVVKNVRVNLFKNISLLHIGFFSDQRKGDMISRFTNDVSEVENTVVNGFKAVREPITLIFYITMLFVISVKLSLITLIVLPLTGAMIAAIIRQLKKRAVQSQETMGRIVNILDEAFSGMRVINAFNARNFILGKIDDETTFHRKVNISMSRKNELASPMSEFLGIVLVACLLYFGGREVISGKGLTSSEFLTFLTIYVSMLQPAKNFASGITTLQKGVVSAQRIFTIMDTKSAIQNKPNPVMLSDFKDSIEFKNVSFAYDKDYVLKNINLRVEKGKTIALVGPSGGGKSTLADLVPRFYDPTSGVVLLDGIALTEYEIESLRKQIGVVTQESILFNDTILNNIAFGMEHVNEEDVMNAARVANAHDFIMQTENGYQTLIGERGSKLSGGQRQRLSIARAVLKNPPILILDEATSALDSESEKLVQDALTNLMKNRTSIVIAHRLSTIQHAHEIIVIQQGEILERGSHENLITTDGLYKKLIQIQKL